MRNNWRKKRGEFHYQGPKSQHKRSPIHNGTWQPTVPSWEKKFCYAVGCVSWKKLVETKSMYCNSNVEHWNDSAVEVAFNNAKNRYWAEINGFPCNISLPNPDTFIDEIDWSCDDPALILDIDREPENDNQRNKEDEGVDLGGLLSNQSFSGTGWGDAEEEVQKNPWESKLTQTRRSWEENDGKIRCRLRKKGFLSKKHIRRV